MKKTIILLIIAMTVVMVSLCGCTYDPDDSSTDVPQISTEKPKPVKVTPPSTTTEAPEPTAAPETTEAPESTEATTTPTTTSTPETTTEATTTKAETKAELDYVLNTNTMKFHNPSCNSVSDIKDKNREDYHGTRDDVVARGFSPCGRCKP